MNELFEVIEPCFLEGKAIASRALEHCLYLQHLEFRPVSKELEGGRIDLLEILGQVGL
jgi:hypothetical protein